MDSDTNPQASKRKVKEEIKNSDISDSASEPDDAEKLRRKKRGPKKTAADKKNEKAKTTRGKGRVKRKRESDEECSSEDAVKSSRRGKKKTKLEEDEEAEWPKPPPLPFSHIKKSTTISNAPDDKSYTLNYADQTFTCIDRNAIGQVMKFLCAVADLGLAGQGALKTASTGRF